MIKPITGAFHNSMATMKNNCRMLASVPSVNENSHMVMVVMWPKRSMISPTRFFSK